MKAFTFDLQRFADVCSLNGTNYSSLAAAYAAASDGDTITLLQDATGNGFEISKNITFDLGGYTYTIDDNSYGYNNRAFTSSTGANYTFKNGTLLTRRQITYSITNSGTLTLEDINIASTTRAAVQTSGSTATNYIKGSSSVVALAGKYTLDNGIVITSSGTSRTNSPTITTSSDNTAVVTWSSVSNRYSFTATEGSKEVTYSATSRATSASSSDPSLYVAYDASGNPSVQNVTSGQVFIVTTNSTSGTQTVTYTVSDAGIQATAGGITKVLQNVTVNPDTPIAMTYLDFDDSNSYMVPAIFASSGVLSVSSSDLTLLNAGDELLIVDADDYSKSYGTLTKVDGYTFALTKAGTDTLTLSSIVINDALTANISADFRNIPITAYVSNRVATSLTSSSSNPFTLSSDTSAVVSLQGDVSVSLIGGSIKTANSDVSIRTGNNTVYYTASGNGVTVNASSGNGTISGIDVGESFVVGSTSYWREDVGLRTGATGAFTSNVASVSANDNSLAIDLASLRGAVGSFIQPAGGVLEVGKTHTGDAVVVDSTVTPQVKYAELLVDSSSTVGNAYTLTPASDGDTESFLGATDTISITGGTRGTTIYQSLVNGTVNGSAKAMTIAAGTGSTPDATFKVTAVSGDTFVVNLRSSSAETKITNATGITLLSGTINATKGQTITLGEGGRAFYVSASSSGMNVTFDNGTATITAAANDTFTIDGQSFVVDSNSDGMTFTVTADNITANNLGTADGDAFTYGGANYSVRGAGFIKADSSGTSIWSDLSGGERTGNHSLTGGSIIIESLNANDTHTWDAVATVRASDDSATLPPSDTSTKVTLIGNDLKQTYGIFTKSGTGCTLTTGSGTNEAKLSKIAVTSGVDSFEFGAGLDSITIQSAVASLMVTEDEGNDGYEVTLISSSTDNRPPAILDGISRVSLISGSLRSDSAFTTNVLNKGIVAVDQSVTLTSDTSDASINGLTVGHRFSVEGGDDFNMSAVGLVNEDGRYLLGTREGNPIIFSELDSDTPWGGLIAAENLTITSSTTTALIVDNTSSPSALYADYMNDSEHGQSIRVANSADAWDSDITIYVSDTTVNFTSYFEDKKIQGVSSKAAFTVEDGVAFSVQDVRTGAVIGSATNISQTAGTISLASGQAIHSDAGSIKAGTGNLTFTVNDTAGTIGALDNADVFSLETDESAQVEYTRNHVGIVTDDNRILTGLAVRESVTVAQLLGDNWTNTVQINSAGVLAIPPTVGSDLASPWIILSNDKDSAYGTLEQTDSGYSIHRSNNAIASLESDWASSNTISVLSAAQPVTLTKDYSGAWIAGLRSGASVSTSDATDDFVFIDGTGGATLSGSGAVKVNQAAGVFVPWVGQTVTAAGNYTIAATSEDGDIKISVNGSAATVTNLTQGDTFTINGYSYEMLTNGTIRRDGIELWKAGTITSAMTAADLTDDDNWYALLPIGATTDLTITSAMVAPLKTGQATFLVDELAANEIYGTITKTDDGYTLTGEGKNTNLNSVTIDTALGSAVTFGRDFFITNEIPITEGDATFTVTDRSVENFTVNYDGTTSVDTATTLTLSSGTLKLTDAAQVVKAGSTSTTAAVNSGTITVNYDGTTLTVGSMDTAGDSVKINGTYDYTYVSGNGMTIEIASGTTTFKNLDDDSFEYNGVTYAISSSGFVKTDSSGNSSIWTNDDITAGDGVTVAQLTDTANWTGIVQSDGNIVIDSTSTATVVYVGNVNNPTEKVYGRLEVDGSARSLIKGDSANTSPTSIEIDGVTVTVDSGFGTVPITPQTAGGVAATVYTDGNLTFNVASLADGTTFTVNENTYTKDSSGIHLGNSIWTREDNLYVLPTSPDAIWKLYEGTFTINVDQSVTVTDGTTDGTTISVTDGDKITATAQSGAWTALGELTSGDVFSIASTSYKVLNDNATLGQINANGTVDKFLTTSISGNALAYDTAVNGTYVNVVTLTDGVLDLTAQPSDSNYTAYAVGTTDDGDPDPTKRIATVTYDGSKYTLNTPGSNIDELTSVSLGGVSELTSTIDTVVTTPTTGTFTVNGDSFTARSALQIQSGTSSGGATLIGGTVYLAAGEYVTTLNNTITNTIAASTGAITVAVGDNVTIGGLTAGRVFSVDGTAYTVTSIGITNAAVTRLLDISNNAVTTTALGGSDWQTVYEAPAGALTIDSSTPADVTVVNISNPTNAVKYGTITRSGSAYAFTSSGSDKLGSITVDGVEAVFDSTCAGISITAGGATFSVAASSNFTVDATSTPELSNVEAISLTSGTIQAPTNVTITVGTRKVTATNGAMNVGLESNKVVVSALNTGDKFTVGSTSYEMTAAGLYDELNGLIVTEGVSDDKTTFIVDDAAYGNVITLDTDGNLDLTFQPSSTSYTALVVGRDSDGNVDVSKTIATVTYDGTGFTLTAGANVSDMASVSLNSVKTLTTAVETNVNTTSTGTYSINGKSFVARDALTIETSANDAILTSGTVSLAQGTSVTTPNNTIAATTGTVFANVNGSTITVSNLAAGRVFTLDDTSYTMTNIGLSDGSRLLESVTTSVTNTDLSGSAWQTILQATDGALSITSSTTSAVVADMTSATSAVKYGTLTRSGSAYTYARNDSNTLSSITLSGVAVTFDRSNAGVSIDTGSATFSVSATARNFTVDATSTPALTNVTAVSLTSGTIQAPSSIPVTVGSRRITATNGAMNIGINSSGQTVVSELNTGDTFTVGSTSYEMTSAGLYDSANGLIVTAGVSDDKTQFIVDDAAYGNVLSLDTDGNLDLTFQPSTTSYTALVVGRDSDGNVDVSKTIASVTYDGTGFTLTAGANVSDMTSVSLSAVKTLTTAIETTVDATTTGTYTVNSKTFVAREPLTIETTPDSAILIDGTVGLGAGTSVTTPNNTIDATTGTITVEVDGSTVNIGSLAAGRVFEVDDTPYTMTAIGLTNSDRNRLLEVDTSTTVAALGGSAWQTILQATDGALSITSSTTSAVVADMTSATSAVKYGTLTRSGAVFTYAANDSNVLSSITLSGVEATFDSSNAGISIDTGSATFSVSASSDFTIDATGTPELSNVTAVSLTSGTIQAPSNVTITVGSRRITATNGNMNIGLNSSGQTVVSELNTGDTFTVGSTSYEMTAAGLYDSANGQLVTSGVSDDMTTFIVDDAAFGNVLSLDTDGNLDLRTAPSTTTYTALVVGRDSDGNVDVTKPVATLSYDGTGYTLTAGANASEMTSVTLNSVKTLTTAIETTVVTPSSGTYTINNKSFTARAALEIATSASGATLASGTVALSAGNSVDTASNTVTANTGAITVAVSGSRVTIGNLAAGRVFSVDDTSYTMTAIGLSDGSRLLDVGTAVTVAALGGTNWQNILQATGGALSIDSDTTAAVVADLSSATSAVKYGNLTKSGSAFTYAKDGSALSSITLSGVAATFDSSNAGISIDTGSATFSVSASSDFTIDATGTPELSNVTAVTLTEGTIQAPQDVTITVGSRRITATNGNMNIGLNSSAQTVVSELNTGDTFTVGTTSYEMTAAGLYNSTNGQIVTSGVSDDLTTFVVDDAAYGNVITLDEDGNLDLTAAHVAGYTALVVGRDSSGNIDLSKRVANVTCDGSSYTLTAGANVSEMTSVSLSAVSTLTTTIETTVTTPASGTYTINGDSFAARSALTIETESGGAKLIGGTVALTAGNSVDTANNTVTATTGTITVNVDGSAVTIGNLTAGKVFSVDENAYTMTAIGLSNDNRLLDVSGSVTLDDLNGSDWQTILQATGGALAIDGDTTAGAVVDISSPTNAVKYGNLTKSGSAFTYTRDGNNTLGSITLDGVEATFDNSNAGVTIDTGNAVFTVSASGDFTVDATSTPELSDVSAVTLTSGTVKAPNDITVSVGSRRITATGGDMTVGLVDNKVVVSELNTGDTFNVGTISYEMTNAGLYDAVNGQIVTEGVSEDRTTFVVDDAAFGNVITLDDDGYLDLTATPVTGYAALVVGLDGDGNIDISKAIATVEYDGTGYTLTQAGSYITELNGVLLSTVKTLTTSVATTVITNAVSSYTVNDKTFDATTPLEITTTATSALLQGGTVNVAAGYDLNTPSNTIASTAGTITVNVDDSTVTIGNLAAGRAFSVDDTAYSMTSIGLSDGNRILQTDSDVTLDELNGTDWLAILNAPSGALTVTADTASSIVVDISNPSSAVNYGILTKAGTNYTYVQSGSYVLQSVTLDGVSATFPQTCAAATFTAGDATFSITASGDFTINDTGSVPAIGGATAVTLTAGTVQPELDIPVTVGSRKITATGGTVTVGLADGKTQIGALNAGDAFTVGNTAYVVTTAGELFDASDSMIVTAGFSGDTFTIDDATLTRIITADGTNLDLTDQTQSALVYDSDTDPTALLATLNVTGSSYTLSGTDDNIIKTVDIKAGSELNIDFDATISGSGSLEVNDVTYNGTGDLIIYADETASQLYSGTITLTPAVTAPEAANDSATLAVENGSIDATAVNGYYTTLSDLDSGDSFTYNGNTYTQSKFGLLNDGNICENLAGSTLTLSALDSANWSEFLAPVANVLDLTSANVNAVVYDDYSAPTKKVADLSIVNGRKILKGASGAAKAIQTVVLSDGDILTVDFSTQVSAGSATVNGTNYIGTSDLLIDAKANGSSLYSGSVTVAAGRSLKATNDSAALAVTSGTVNATASQGHFISLNDVDAGDSFSFNGNNYTMTALGLLSGNTIAQELNDSFIDLTTLDDAQWLTFIAPRNGTLDISNVTSDKIVFDSTSNPVNKLADLTVDGSDYTLIGTRYAADIDTVHIAKDSTLTIDFAAQVTAPIGTATVNGKSFNATTAVTLDATQGDATLARGTVALANADSVTTSSGYNFTANAGNGLSVTASTGALTVGGLNAGDDFSLDDRDYSLRDIGLLRDDLIYLHSAGVLSSGSVTVDALLSDDWRQAIFIDGSLILPLDFDNGFLLDEDLTRLYGYLTRNGRAYTLTAPSNVNATLTDIALDAVSLIADSAFASVPLTANDSHFADVLLSSGANTFTLDATDTPTFAGVAAFTLAAGSVVAKGGQLVSAGSHLISGDLTVALDGGVIVSGFADDFTLDGDTYHVAPGGLINLTDSAVVTGGLTGNTLRVEDIDLSPFIGVSNGTLDLTNAAENVLVYDSATDPANQIATLTVDGNKFTLNGSDASSLIQTVNVATGSDLTVDFAAQVTAPAGTVTVNGKTYNATTAVTLQSDGTTSMLTLGTVALASGGSVNTTNGNTIAATAGDGLTVNAASDSVTVSGLNSGDTFTADGNTYTVGTSNLLHDGKLWTGDTYQDGVTLDELNDDANWTDMLSATYSSVAVDGATLGDGETAVLVDNTTDPTKTYGTLSKTDGIYLLMKDDTQDDKLAAISVLGTIIDIDVELADVPITTINADESESVFTVKPSAGVETFRVDATGNSPRIYGVDEIDLIRGKVFPQDGQIIKPADGSETITLSYGNGTYTIGDKTITIGGLADDETVDIEINGDGNINSVYRIPKDAYVIYDGVTYTAPFDDARLSFEEDPCYFDGYTLPVYNVQIDPDGNIKVDTGIQFGKVVPSGKTLGEDGTIQIGGDGSSVKITNESDIPLKVVDNDGDTLAENLNADDGVTFSEDGVSADDLQAVAGATVYLDDGQALTADGEATVAAQGDATVGVNEDGTGISVDGSAVIDAPADTELTLGNAPYTVKGADFETSGTAQATVTSDGVKVDLGISDAITHDEMTLTGGESSTAEINGNGDVTLTSGATAANATDKPVTVDGTVQLDDKTVKASDPVEVTEKVNGLLVGDTELTVGGDTTGYQVNIDGGDISGLENVGSGVTVGGLSDATIKTNEAGSLTVGDKTFTTTGDSAVTYGLSEGAITSISDLDGILAGDFSEGVTVNGDPLTVDSSLKGAIAIAADEDGVSAVQTGDADTYIINGHAYETSGDALFGMSNASVTGVTTDDGTFAIGQDETNFQINGASLTLSRNTNPVTLGISGGAISGVCGVDGAISGLSDATVYDLAIATINGKVFDVSGTTFDAIVSDGTVNSIVGLIAPATVNTAPDVSIVTRTDGDFRIGGRDYTIDDTIDNSVTFTTDANSRLTGINDFAGSLNGAVTSLTLNGKDFGTNNPAVTISSDGRNITAIDGLRSGDSIGGDIDSATFHMPQGNLTINGGVYTLEDDADGATASRGGKTFVGVEKDASLTVGADGSHRVNGGGGRASVGSVFTVNRDGGYMINPDYLPIIEKTPASEIRARSDGTLAMQETSGTVGAGNDTVVVRRNAEVTADASGESLIIATSGNVTLENYTAGNASIGSFEYTNLANAIKTNAIQFGNGTMTLGDAVITFNANAGSTGATQAQLVNAQGKEQAIGFTHTNGGTVNASGATEAQVLKGNYAEKSNDTQKSGGSNVVGGSGNDTLLVGAGDTVNGGAGDDHIYITDGAFRELGALLIMSAGSDTVHNFNGGYSTASDTIRITDLNALEYEAAANLVLTSGTRQLTFDGLSASSADLVTSTDLAESADTAANGDGSYRLKLSDGNGNYNAAIARAGRNIYVADGDLANVFFGTNSGVNFSEYTGAVSVNLDTGTGNVGTSSAQFKGINQLTGGAGASTLMGAADTSNTLTAGTGGGQIWSNSGNDLMIGQSGKSGATTFRYLAEDGHDTISGFDFATSADAAGDLIDITTANEVTTVSLSGGNVILYINGSDTDYLTLAQGKGNDFRINNLVAQVDDRQLAFDGLANCYVANGGNATLQVDASVESAEIWLNDMKGGLHGTYYLGDITVVDGSRSAGQLILTGNALDNTIIGGAGTNSIWGGYGCDNDVMIGGAGQNTFFFALVNGNDVIQGAHDGDVIDLTTVKTSDIVGTTITDGGTAIGLWDGSVLEVRSNAAVEYKTADGTYVADHASGQWVKTK